MSTARKRLSGAVNGRAVTLAATDEVKGYRRDLGLSIEIGSLRLTTRSAAIVGAALGRRDVFRPHRLLGRATLSAPLFTVPVREGTIDFSLDEGLRQKFESLGVAISPYGPATPLSSAPLTWSLGDLRGDIDPQFEHGTVIATREQGLKLVQAGSPEPREVTWRGIGIGFENGYGGEGGDVVTAGWTLPLGLSGGPPIGQIEFGRSPELRRKGRHLHRPTDGLNPFALRSTCAERSLRPGQRSLQGRRAARHLRLQRWGQVTIGEFWSL